MLPVVRTTQAEADLVGILEYLEERSPPAATRLAQAIDARCAVLATCPGLGRLREELGPGLRSLAIDKHVLIYRITSTAIEVLRIFHGSRDIAALILEDDFE